MFQNRRFILGLLLTLAFILSCGKEGTQPTGSPANSSPVPSTDLVQSNDGMTIVKTEEKIKSKPDSISTARREAEQLLHAAAQKTGNATERELFHKMQQSLKSAKINVPPAGHDLKTCVQESSVLAFVNLLSPNTIHICARAAGADTRHLSQVLVHETAHVVGVHDECDATRIEVAVVRASHARLPFRNGYMQRCGIK